MTVGMTEAQPVVGRRYVPTVVNCYTVFDKFFPACGMLDYTEGLFNGDPTLPLDEAQLNQIRYVLDEAQCTVGTRILEVGCGNGRLLDEVKRRGGIGVGITISPEQVDLCRRRGLDVRLLDYKDLGAHAGEYRGTFDAVIANGPIEHFVQADEAARGQTDLIYRQMFDLFHQAIDPKSSNQRFVNTTIHFERVPEAKNMLRSPWSFRPGSDDWHWAWLRLSFGGFYPTHGQFERCAAGRFRLLKTVDGTQDYHFTSEQWLRKIKSQFRSLNGLSAFTGAIPVAFRHSKQTFGMLACMLGSQSWNWQFRGGDRAPTKLLRQTWVASA